MENENFENEDSNEYESEDLTQESPQDSELVKRLRAQLKTQGKQYGDLAESVKELKRKDTFSQAEVQLNDAQKTAIDKMLGDTDFTPEKIRETAAALGFIANPDLSIPDSSAKSLNNIADASAGGDNQVGTPDEEFQNALRNAPTQKDALAILEKSGWLDRTGARWDRAFSGQ